MLTAVSLACCDRLSRWAASLTPAAPVFQRRQGRGVARNSRRRQQHRWHLVHGVGSSTAGIRSEARAAAAGLSRARLPPHHATAVAAQLAHPPDGAAACRPQVRELANGPSEAEYLPALDAAATVCIPVSVAVSLSDGQPPQFPGICVAFFSRCQHLGCILLKMPAICCGQARTGSASAPPPRPTHAHLRSIARNHLAPSATTPSSPLLERSCLQASRSRPGAVRSWHF